MSAIEILKAAPSPGLVICHGCDATAESPPVGVPEGWDAAWRHVAGWIFTCPACLDRAEAIFLAGGGGVCASPSKPRRSSMTDEAILDALCACAAARVFVKSTRNARLRAAVVRLRYRGLVAFDGWRPSASAMADWRDRSVATLSRSDEGASASLEDAAGAGADVDHERQLPAEAEAAGENPPAAAAASPPAAKPKTGRRDSWAGEKQERFLAVYRETGSITQAAAAVGLPQSQLSDAYRAKARHPEFSSRWDEIRTEVKARPKISIWDSAERQDAIVAVLREKGSKRQALMAVGLAGTDQRELTDAMRRSPDFAERCREAVEAFKAAGTEAPRPKSPPKQPIEIKASPPRPTPEAPRKATKPGIVAGGTFNGYAPAPIETSEPPRRVKSVAEIAADNLRYLQEQERFREMRPPLGPHEAQQILQRRGFSVCRASTVGGEPGMWAVGTLRLTEAEMIAKAARHRQ